MAWAQHPLLAESRAAARRAGGAAAADGGGVGRRGWGAGGGRGLGGNAARGRVDLRVAWGRGRRVARAGVDRRLRDRGAAMRRGRDVSARTGVSAVPCARAVVSGRGAPARRLGAGWLVRGRVERAGRRTPGDGRRRGRGRRARFTGVSSGGHERDDPTERRGQRKDDDAPPAADRTGRRAPGGALALIGVDVLASVIVDRSLLRRGGPEGGGVGG